MSVGREIVFFAMWLHGAFALGIGFMWSMIPQKIIGLVGFILFYLGIAVWYTAKFNFQMLIYVTFYPLYVIVGLIGFVLGVYWLGTKGYYDRAKKGVKP